jgi:hypothetical protein
MFAMKSIVGKASTLVSTLVLVLSFVLPAFSEGPAAQAPAELTVHGLTAWDAPDDPCVYLSFAPISPAELLGNIPLKRTMMAGEEIEVADVAPVLDSTCVDVSIDGKRAVVLSVGWYFAGYGDLSGSDTKYMPICVIRVERHAMNVGRHAVQVVLRDKSTGAIGRSETVLETRPARKRL